MALTFVSLLMASTARNAFAVFLKPIQVEFGVERATVALAASLGIVVGALAQPLVGRLLDRLGPRLVVPTTSVLVTGLGALGSSAVRAPWHLYVTHGASAGLVSSTLVAGVVSRWFARRRGLAIALCQLGVAAGQVITTPLAVALEGSVGWRWGYAIMGLFLVFGCFPVLIWRMRDEPADLGLRPYGADEDTQAVPAGAAAPSEGARQRLPLAQAAQMRDFWFLAASYCVAGSTASGLIATHLIAWADDRGFPPAAAATAYAVMGVCNVPAALLAGWSTDRLSPKRLLGAVYLLRAVALLYLLAVGDPIGLNVFAVMIGVAWVANVPPTIALAANMAGPTSTASIFGWMSLSHQMGAALTAWGAGAVFDRTGTYAGVFAFSALLNAAAALLAFSLRLRPSPLRPSR
ncbi:MAG: MFS transporter [Chloroflexi bacterium]|nr:MFS transporter [Chloroflexota bacterium]